MMDSPHEPMPARPHWRALGDSTLPGGAASRQRVALRGSAAQNSPTRRMALFSMKKDTLLAQIGRDPARYQGMVNTPVFRTSTVIFPDLAAYEARGGDAYKKMRYGLYGTPTTFAFEEAVAKMEGGYAAVALPSGLAAITAALCALIKTCSPLPVTHY